MRNVLVISLLLSIHAMAIYGGYPISSRDPLSKAIFLLKDESNPEGLTACTTFAIDEYRLLTAAHCVIDKHSFSVIRTSDYYRDVKRGIPFRKQIHIEVGDIHIHPNYLHEYLQLSQKDRTSADRHLVLSELRFANYDIAIIKLDEKMKDVIPIKLPDEIDTNYVRYVYLNGYGKDILNNEPPGKLSQVHINNLISKTVNLADFSTVVEPEGETIARGICNGDSGGPATFLADDQKTYLFGVQVTAGYEPGTNVECKGRAQLLKIKPFLNWINGIR